MTDFELIARKANGRAIEDEGAFYTSRAGWGSQLGINCAGSIPYVFGSRFNSFNV